MGAVTHDEYHELFTHTSQDSSKIISLSSFVKVATTPWELFRLNLILGYRVKKLNVILKRMDDFCLTVCINQDCSTDDLSKQKERIHKAVKSLKNVIDRQEGKYGFPVNLSLPYLKKHTDILDDKLENYWFSSDQDIRDLTAELSMKMDSRQHAVY